MIYFKNIIYQSFYLNLIIFTIILFSIKEFLLSCIPNHTPLEFNGIHAVAGNPGSGKTTIIKKLCKEALKKIRSDEIAIISFDDPRLGIWSQFQLIGAKLGIDCFKASSLTTLKLILEDISDKKFILIDILILNLNLNSNFWPTAFPICFDFENLS